MSTVNTYKRGSKNGEGKINYSTIDITSLLQEQYQSVLHITYATAVSRKTK